jgi:hypothetical protein
MTRLINSDSLKAKLNWLFSHDTVSVNDILKAVDEEPTVEAIRVDEIQTLYDAAIQYRDELKICSELWDVANNQAIGIGSVLDLYE